MTGIGNAKYCSEIDENLPEFRVVINTYLIFYQPLPKQSRPTCKGTPRSVDSKFKYKYLTPTRFISETPVFTFLILYI